MKNTLRAVLTHIKNHPYYWIFTALLIPPVTKAYDGLLDHLGAEGWLVAMLGTPWLSWILTSLLDYLFVLIVAVVSLVVGVRIGQRDTQAHLLFTDSLPPTGRAVEIGANRIQAIAARTQNDIGTAELKSTGELPADAQQLIARQFLVRGVFTPDGHDIIPMFHIRNRSKATLSLQVRQASWNHVYAINRGFSVEPHELVLGPEKTNRIVMPGTRLFSASNQKLHAKLVIDFWQDTDPRITMEVGVELELGDFPDRQGIDKPVGIIEHPKARYFRAVNA